MATHDQEAAQRLKNELKSWERTFAASNGGRKPTKKDVKADPDISGKYKQYESLCKRRNQSTHLPERKLGTNTAREHATSQPNAQTPRTSRTYDLSKLSPKKSPVKLACMSPTPQAIRRRLGPTPQKNGHILGLFDGIVSATPSRHRKVLGERDHNIVSTPSKHLIGDTLKAGDDDCRASEILGRTPTSSGKRFMLDGFATPVKRRRHDSAQTPTHSTIHTTPQFLRRGNVLFGANAHSVTEEEKVVSEPAKPAFKKRSLARSLSSILQALRAQEQDKADEDLELLHKLEAEAEGMEKPVRRKSEGIPLSQQDGVEKGSEMPLGPDPAPLSDNEIPPAKSSLDAAGDTLPKWKKKGLKRQTKRVKMRPAPRPAKGNVELPSPDCQDSTADEDPAAPDSTDGGDLCNQDPMPTTSRPVASSNKDVKQPSRRKVSETAHANFCRLKIKNKNSKAKGRARYGRR